jgi:predicted transcriptional regulator
MDNSSKDLLNSGRRDKIEIMAAIIATTQKPSKITLILGQTNLSYPMMKKNLRNMLRLGLIEVLKVAKAGNKTGQVFQATEKGFTFLKTYCDLLRLLYSDAFLVNDSNLAVACLKYCKEAEPVSER